jgi:hypothetical protein
MHHILLRKIVLALMFLSITLGNCAVFKLSVHDFLNEPPLRMHVLIIFCAIFSRKTYQSYIWWKELV